MQPKQWNLLNYMSSCLASKVVSRTYRQARYREFSLHDTPSKNDILQLSLALN